MRGHAIEPLANECVIGIPAHIAKDIRRNKNVVRREPLTRGGQKPADGLDAVFLRVFF